MITFPAAVFNMEQLIQAQERAKELAASYEAERLSRREASEAAQKRANRRANEAEQKLVEAGQEYAMKIKIEKAMIAKDFATMKEERDVTNAKNADLIQELATLKTEYQAFKDASSSSSPANSQLRQQLATQESQLALYDQLRTSLANEAQRPREMSIRLKHESNEHNIQQSLLTSSINKLNDDFEDVTHKVLGKYAREIKLRNEELVKQRALELEALENTMNALEAMLAPFSTKAPTVLNSDPPTNNPTTAPNASSAAKDDSQASAPAVPTAEPVNPTESAKEGEK